MVNAELHSKPFCTAHSPLSGTPKVWRLGQPHQDPGGMHYKCRCSGPALGFQSETLGVGPRNLWFCKPSGWFWCLRSLRTTCPRGCSSDPLSLNPASLCWMDRRRKIQLLPYFSGTGVQRASAHNRNDAERPSQHCKQLLGMAFHNLFDMDFQNNPGRWSELSDDSPSAHEEAGLREANDLVESATKLSDRAETHFLISGSTLLPLTVNTGPLSTVCTHVWAPAPTHVRIRRLRNDGK